MPAIRGSQAALTQQLFEVARLRALHATGLLDSEPEEAFDDIRRLAAKMLQSPIATVAFIDDARVWLKSAEGMTCASTPRKESICHYTLLALRQRIVQVDELTRTADALAKDLLSSNERFCAFMDHSPVAAYIKDQDGRMRFYNRKVAETFCITQHDWLGKSDHEIWPSELADEYRAADLAVLAQTGLVEVEERTPAPHGSHLYWKSYKFPFTDANGQRFLAGIAIDVTREKCREAELETVKEELAARSAELRRMTVTDALTGLPNRRGFNRWLDQCVSSASRSNRPLSMMMIDVDHFSVINDIKGHLAGDAMLAELSRVLLTLVSPFDHVSRLGGEEFAILLPDTTAKEALALAENICRTISQQSGMLQGMTVSIGVTPWTPEKSGNMLIEIADASLHRAKRSGRNQVILGTSLEALRSDLSPIPSVLDQTAGVDTFIG
ncbi:diguanylate cyclase [Terriglobus sp. YAF25]|uniref:GGDEF domain-containing protein n=1 Tax=Terriglobus sp. YAF25 TaxID=3233080 RepID=UPI003F99D331